MQEHGVVFTRLVDAGIGCGYDLVSQPANKSRTNPAGDDLNNLE